MTAHANMILLLVEGYNGYDFRGHFFTPLDGQKIPFSGYAEFVLRMEAQFDKQNFPQKAQETRSFDLEKFQCDHPVPKEFSLHDHPIESSGKKCIVKFIVHVLFRQHSSWQGRVEWLGKHKQEVNFRSSLELLQIINGVLETQMTNCGFDLQKAAN